MTSDHWYDLVLSCRRPLIHCVFSRRMLPRGHPTLTSPSLLGRGLSSSPPESFWLVNWKIWHHIIYRSCCLLYFPSSFVFLSQELHWSKLCPERNEGDHCLDPEEIRTGGRAQLQAQTDCESGAALSHWCPHQTQVHQETKVRKRPAGKMCNCLKRKDLDSGRNTNTNIKTTTSSKLDQVTA